MFGVGTYVCNSFKEKFQIKFRLFSTMLKFEINKRYIFQSESIYIDFSYTMGIGGNLTNSNL